jgi:hypothetical protein
MRYPVPSFDRIRIDLVDGHLAEWSHDLEHSTIWRGHAGPA